jgi:hypothetical protein
MRSVTTLGSYCLGRGPSSHKSAADLAAPGIVPVNITSRVGRFLRIHVARPNPSTVPRQLNDGEHNIDVDLSMFQYRERFISIRSLDHLVTAMPKVLRDYHASDDFILDD